jgi:hypothetical protein
LRGSLYYVFSSKLKYSLLLSLSLPLWIILPIIVIVVARSDKGSWLEDSLIRRHVWRRTKHWWRIRGHIHLWRHKLRYKTIGRLLHRHRLTKMGSIQSRSCLLDEVQILGIIMNIVIFAEIIDEGLSQHVWRCRLVLVRLCH